MLVLTGTCWQKQVTHYLLPSLEQSSISKDDVIYLSAAFVCIIFVIFFFSFSFVKIKGCHG
jgi:heme/copper-type cytochrome/quinol oxidase subunit 2